MCPKSRSSPISTMPCNLLLSQNLSSRHKTATRFIQIWWNIRQFSESKLARVVVCFSRLVDWPKQLLQYQFIEVASSITIELYIALYSSVTITITFSSGHDELQLRSCGAEFEPHIRLSVVSTEPTSLCPQSVPLSLCPSPTCTLSKIKH